MRFTVAAIVMFELFCAVGLAFMVRFLIALFMDERAKSRCYVVHLTVAALG